jgi:hypothetical protein
MVVMIDRRGRREERKESKKEIHCLLILILN